MIDQAGLCSSGDDDDDDDDDDDGGGSGKKEARTHQGPHGNARHHRVRAMDCGDDNNGDCQADACVTAPPPDPINTQDSTITCNTIAPDAPVGPNGPVSVA